MAKSKKHLDLDELVEKGVIRKGSDERFIIRRIPFGIPVLDETISGGIPRSRITILTGDYSCGKTFLIQLLVKNALEEELQVVYIDAERTYDPIWWEQIGINLDKLLIAQPTTGDEAVNLIDSLAVEGIDVIAVDSLAALVPMEILERKAEEKLIGAQARLINNLMQKMLALNPSSALVCTNQLRSTLGPGPIDTMPGGKGQMFFTSLILRVHREGWLEDGKGNRIGFNMRVVVRKSKVGTPWKECTLPFHFRGEIDLLSLLVERALEASIIKQTGPWYSILGGEKQLGRNTIIDDLQRDEELKKRVQVALGDYADADVQ